MLNDAHAVAREAAKIIAAETRDAVAARLLVKMCRGKVWTWCKWTNASPRLVIPTATSPTCA